MLTHLARDYGDVARIKVGPQHIIVVSHPDLIRTVIITEARRFAKGRGLERTRRLLGQGLLTSEGEFHLRQRRLAQPAFHRERLATYAAVMQERASRTIDSWRDGDTIDVSNAMMRLTLEIAGTTLFGADLAAETEEIGAALTEAFSLFRYSTLPYAELLDSFNALPMNRRFAAARGRLDRTIYRIIADRRASGEDHGDLLSMLLSARDTEGDGSAMTDLQLRDEALTILLAGHETTANALAWTFYLLAQHPSVESRLLAEIESCLGGRPVTAEDTTRLVYARAVLAESNASLSASLDTRAEAVRGCRAWRVSGAARVAGPHESVGRSPRRALVADAAPLRPRSMADRTAATSAEARLLSIRRRDARLHR